MTDAVRISRAFFLTIGSGTIWCHQNVESIVGLKSCLLKKMALLKFNDFVKVFIADIGRPHTKRERLSHSCWIGVTGGEVSGPHLSAGQLLASVPEGQKCLQFQTRLLLTYSRLLGKFARLSFSVRCFHRGKPGFHPLR